MYTRDGREIQSRRIEPNTDLYEYLVVEAARLIADGWHFDNENEVGRVSLGFFLVRGDVRREVRIVPEEHSRWQGSYKPYAPR